MSSAIDMWANFNSRSRTGSDIICIVWFKLRAISIHAPAQGATDDLIAKKKAQMISIHAPAQGATISECPSERLVQFQFTLPHRERRQPEIVVGHV